MWDLVDTLADKLQGFYCEVVREGVRSIVVSRQPVAGAEVVKALRIAEDAEPIVAYMYNAEADTDLTLNFRYLSLDGPTHPMQTCWGLTWFPEYKLK